MPDVRIPRLLELAPNFEALSTEGTVRLGDYFTDGKWVLLFSLPSNFSPVESSELIEFARRSREWARLNVQLLALSIDSLPSHLAWLLDLERIAGLKIGFPLIADPDRRVSIAYGLIHEAADDIGALRSIFLIDPRGIVRAMLCYPLQVGRNLDEIVRILEALRATDEDQSSTPVNWKPGDRVLANPPMTLAEAHKRQQAAQAHTGGKAGDPEGKSWYLTARDAGK